MPTGPDLRIGDAEREGTATLLRENYAQGRLTLEEFNQRLDAVYAARTQKDLDQQVRDLPHAAAPSAPLPVAGVPRGGGRERAGQGSGAGPHHHHGFAFFPLVIAALATWLLIAELHLRVFPWPGKLAIFIAIFAFLRGMLRRAFGVRRGPGGLGRCARSRR